MTTKTKTPAKKRTVRKTTKPAAPKNVISVTTTEFAKTLYPNAQHPAKSLRSRLRNMIKSKPDAVNAVLVKSDAYTYAIPDTKTARDKFAALFA